MYTPGVGRSPGVGHAKIEEINRLMLLGCRAERAAGKLVAYRRVATVDNLADTASRFDLLACPPDLSDVGHLTLGSVWAAFRRLRAHPEPTDLADSIVLRLRKAASSWRARCPH